MANISDTFTGTNGTVPSGYTSTASGAATIQSNALRVVSPATAYAPSHASRSGLANGDLLVDVTINSSVENYPAIHVRQSSNTSDVNGYTLLLQPNGSIYTILKYTSGSFVTLSPGDRSLTFTNGAVYRCRFRFQGSALKAKVWLASGSEPTDWGIEATDTTYTAAGFIHLDSAAGAANTARTNTFDNLVVTDLDAGTTGVLAGSFPAPTGATAAATAGPPGSTLSIGSGAANHFDVQVAPNSGGAVVVHTQAEIAAGYGEAPYFYTTATGGRVHFEARLDAPTTAGSSFSRCELREVNPDGTAASWDPRTGEHVMAGTTVITSLPPVKPEAVVAQVFGEIATADIVSIRTQLVSGTIRLRTRIDGVSITSPQMASPYTVGTSFNWKIRFVGGVREVYWSFGSDPLPGTPQVTAAATTDTSAYFKAGLYNQSGTAAGDAGSAIGAAELSGLTVSHAVVVTGALAGVGPSPTSALAGQTRTGGALAGVGPVPVSAVAASVTSPAALAGAAPGPSGSLVAVTSTPGAISASAPAVVGALSGSSSTTGVVAAAAPSPTAAVVGTVFDPALLAGVAPVAAGALAGSVIAASALAGTAPAPGGGLTAAAATSGVLAGSAPNPTAALAGGATTGGQLTGSAPTPIAALGATAAQPGTLAGTLPTAGAVLAGAVTDLGALAASAPGPTASASGTVTAGAIVTGAVAQPSIALTAATSTAATLAGTGPLPTVTLAGASATGGPIVGELAAPVGAFTAAVAGGGGGLAGLLPTPGAVLAATATATGSVAAIGPDLEAALTGEVTAPGTVSGQLPVAAAGLVGIIAAAVQLTATAPAATGQITSAAPTATGQLAGTLPTAEIQLAAETVETTQGSLIGSWPSLTGALDGVTLDLGELTAGLPAFVGALAAQGQASAELTGLLPLPTAALLSQALTGSMIAFTRPGPAMTAPTVTGPAMTPLALAGPTMRSS